MNSPERRPPDKIVTLLHNLSETIARKTVLKTNITPNQLTLASFVLMIIASFLFSWGKLCNRFTYIFLKQLSPCYL